MTFPAWRLFTLKDFATLIIAGLNIKEKCEGWKSLKSDGK